MKIKRNEYVPTRKEFDLKTFFMERSPYLGVLFLFSYGYLQYGLFYYGFVAIILTLIIIILFLLDLTKGNIIILDTQSEGSKMDKTTSDSRNEETRRPNQFQHTHSREGVKGSSLKESKSGVQSNPLKGNTASTINKSAGNDHLLTTSLLISSSLTTQNTDSTHCSSSSNLSSNTDSTSNTSSDSSSSCDSGGF